MNDREGIARAVSLLAQVYNRRLTPEAKQVWIDALSPHAGPRLFSVLRSACEGERFPAIGSIIAQVRSRPELVEFKQPTLTAGEQQRSEHAAVMSMLWMELNYPDLKESAGGVMRAAFTRQFGADARSLVERARTTYTPAQINSWMDGKAMDGF